MTSITLGFVSSFSGSPSPIISTSMSLSAIRQSSGSVMRSSLIFSRSLEIISSLDAAPTSAIMRSSSSSSSISSSTFTKLLKRLSTCLKMAFFVFVSPSLSFSKNPIIYLPFDNGVAAGDVRYCFSPFLFSPIVSSAALTSSSSTFDMPLSCIVTP